MKITEAIGVRGENLSSKNGAGGKTMRNLFGIRNENLKSKHRKGEIDMTDSIGVRGEHLKSNQRKGERTMSRTLGMGKEHLKSDEGGRTMSKTLGIRWLVVAAGAAMLLVLGAACTKEVEVPGETIIVEKEVVKTVEVPGETIVVEKEVVKTVEVEVPGKTVTVTKEVIKEVEVPGETVVVTKEVLKEVEVPGETVVVTKEVLKVVEVRQGYVTDPTTGKVVTAPQYGGTIRAIGNLKNEGIDPYFRYTAGIWIGLVNEKLGIGDWAVDRSLVGFDTLYLPDVALIGQLAESWENPDPLTYVFKIRDGVFWHDKAPVNGRQLTAHDVAYSFQRLVFGVDGGESSADLKLGAALGKIAFDSITATDDSTVVFKLKEPSLTALTSMLVGEHTFVVAREVVEQFGDIQDWRNVTGTGPYQLTDVLEGSSWTYTKIDDYWGFDPKYPENRLPYADKVEYIIVNDPAAITSLMRSGQADFMGFGLNSHLTSVDQAVNLEKTNPELVFYPYTYRSETAIFWNAQQPPFDDIRVRRAISMAIDFDAIAKSYMQGWGDASPSGPIGPAVLGYALPFEEWPDEVKQYYRYDPEAAEKLLDEAGYPRGADGVRFSTRYGHYEFFDLGYYQIAMDYLRQIGIDVEIEVLTRAVRAEMIRTLSYVGLMTDTWAKEYPTPLAALGQYYSKQPVVRHNNHDAEFDEYYENAQAATTIEEQKAWAQKADLRVAEQLWTIRGPIAPLFGATQPWIKGYNGEGDLGAMQRPTVLQYLWVDQDLKQQMGH